MTLEGSRLTVETPAPLAETIELYAEHGRARRLVVKIAIMQWWKSDTFGFRAGDELVAVIGLCPLPDEEGDTVLDLWFVCRPSIVPHLVSIAHIARLTLRRAAQTTGLRIRAHVPVGYRPGQRLAKIIGLERVRDADGMECWDWRA